MNLSCVGKKKKIKKIITLGLITTLVQKKKKINDSFTSIHHYSIIAMTVSSHVDYMYAQWLNTLNGSQKTKRSHYSWCNTHTHKQGARSYTHLLCIGIYYNLFFSCLLKKKRCKTNTKRLKILLVIIEKIKSIRKKISKVMLLWWCVYINRLHTHICKHKYMYSYKVTFSYVDF